MIKCGQKIMYTCAIWPIILLLLSSAPEVLLWANVWQGACKLAAFILLCRTNIKTLWQTWMLHNRHTTLYNKIVTSFIKEGDIQKRSGHYNKYGWKLSKSWYLYIIFRLSKTRKWPPNTLKFRNFPVSIWLIFLQLFWVQPCHKKG